MSECIYASSKKEVQSRWASWPKPYSPLKPSPQHLPLELTLRLWPLLHWQSVVTGKSWKSALVHHTVHVYRWCDYVHSPVAIVRWSLIHGTLSTLKETLLTNSIIQHTTVDTCMRVHPVIVIWFMSYEHSNKTLQSLKYNYKVSFVFSSEEGENAARWCRTCFLTTCFFRVLYITLLLGGSINLYRNNLTT